MWLRRALLAAIALIVALLAASAYLFVWSPQDSPHRSDAIVVLAGSHNARLDKGIALMRHGFGRVLVVSRDPTWPPQNRFCGQRSPFPVVCFQAEPFSTRGEARALARLAREHRWRAITLVTSRYHVFRARLIFERCFHGRLYVVGASYPVLTTPLAVALEWAKLVLALTFRRSC